MAMFIFLIGFQSQRTLLEVSPEAQEELRGAVEVSSQKVLTHPTHPFYALETDDPGYWGAVTDRVIVGFKPGVDAMGKVGWLESLGPSSCAGAAPSPQTSWS